MATKTQLQVIYLFLAAATLIAFWQVHLCGFITLDDPEYVAQNLHIRNGITTEAIRWAFTTGHAANWHPVTWISHMLDVELFGLRPGLHHLTNLLFHIANVLLLFFVFHRMTKAPWKSAFVAALFALHPLHVESVAWVAERKDVLSTFFWMLTMGTYIRYVEHPRFRSYLAVFTFLALGLMAKPMLVTLPFVLLLLDYWPLQRLQGAGSGKRGAGSENENENTNLVAEPLFANKRKGKSSTKNTVQARVKEEKPADRKYRLALIGPLLWEKLPLFALAALSSIATFIAQQKGGAVVSLEGIPTGERIANAFVSYIIYAGKSIWPDKLAVYYPHPGSWPLWEVLGAVLLLIAVTIIVVRAAKRFPYLATGWLWFAGTLVPVIGIVQVGGQAMADRYTYVPLIGLFVMAAWGIPELLKDWRYRKEALFASSSLVLLSLFIVTWTQVGYWRNSVELYDHTLKVTSNNYIIYNSRGYAYCRLGNLRQAIQDFDKAVEIEPQYVAAYYNRGATYGKLGNNMKAIEDYDRVIKIDPEYLFAYVSRGEAYTELANPGQAIPDFDKAIEINPKYAMAYNGRAAAYLKLGNRSQAISDYDKAIEINPEYAEIRYNRGVLYQSLGNHKLAIDDYNKAIEINPYFAKAYYNRGVVYSELGNPGQAILDYDRAIEIDSKYVKAYYNRGVAYGEIGNQSKAISDFDMAIQINHEYAEAYNNRGVAYAKLGNRTQAIEDLQKAARLDSEDARNSLRSIGIDW